MYPGPLAAPPGLNNPPRGGGSRLAARGDGGARRPERGGPGEAGGNAAAQRVLEGQREATAADHDRPADRPAVLGAKREREADGRAREGATADEEAAT